MTDLAGTQISNLLEALPGIAQVLRSPVADAFVNLIRAATGQAPFSMADADEIMKYAVRRNLLAAEESERILAEAKAAADTRAAAARARAHKAAPARATAARRTAGRPASRAAAKRPAAKKKPAAKKPAPRKKTRPSAKKKPAAKK